MNIKKRVESGKKVRAKKSVPGVIYGSGIDSVAIQAEYQDVMKTFNQYGRNMTFTIDLDGDDHIVYIKDIQTDYMNTNQITHFDLQKVSSTDTITSYVPLNLIGRDDRAKIGLVLTINLDEVEVEYNVGKGVSSIDVDLSGLQENESVHVSDIEVPEGITMLSDPDEVVASLTYVTMEEIEEPTAEEDEVLEVEAIKQGPAEDEDSFEEEE
ncbi:MAG: 50S ribosomal protein L25 [Candidatus Izemoplasma sp.]|nr:50S ribosomal protein L25 [Candidatus Izemoplasma sp.]